MNDLAIKQSSPSLVRTVGFAMFAMFFGAGNVIFPLLLGRAAGDQIGWALLGMFLTAIIVPFIGVNAMVGFDGDYKRFFNRMGKIPGAIAIFLILCLIGPFAGIPRVVAFSYTTLSLSIPQIPLWSFSLVFCSIIFFLALKKKKIISILGNILTPILLAWLVAVIISGFSKASHLESTMSSVPKAFLFGLREGYNTLDLLAAFFFSTIVMAVIARSPSTEGKGKTLFKASLLAGGLLTIIYGGLAYIAAAHNHHLADVPPDQLLGALANYLLGGWAGLFASMTVALACLTTGITLASIFSDIISREVFRGRIGYVPCLVITLIIAYFISYLKVTGIIRLIAPILVFCYPALIALSLFNLLIKPKKSTTTS